MTIETDLPNEVHVTCSIRLYNFHTDANLKPVLICYFLEIILSHLVVLSFFSVNCRAFISSNLFLVPKDFELLCCLTFFKLTDMQCF